MRVELASGPLSLRAAILEPEVRHPSCRAAGSGIVLDYAPTRPPRVAPIVGLPARGPL